VSLGPRSLAAAGLALLTLARPVGAADPPPAPTAVPFEARPSYQRAWVAMGVGVALTGLSFVLAEQADKAYARYEVDLTSPELDADYDQAVRYDRFATGALLAGQLSLALGLYWRLVHHHPEPAAGETGLTPGAPRPTLAGSTAAPPLWCAVRRGELRLGVALEF
jgi:hypothetical protein